MVAKLSARYDTKPGETIVDNGLDEVILDIKMSILKGMQDPNPVRRIKIGCERAARTKSKSLLSTASFHRAFDLAAGSTNEMTHRLTCLCVFDTLSGYS